MKCLILAARIRDQTLLADRKLPETAFKGGDKTILDWFVDDVTSMGKVDGCNAGAPGSLAAWLFTKAQVHAWEMPGKRYDIGNLKGYEDVQSVCAGKHC